MSEHDYFVRVRHMLDFAREAVGLAKGKSQSGLGGDRLLDLATLHLITLIGEAANQIPQDVQSKYPQIAWSDIIGMRHRLVHGYDQIDYDILWQTLSKDIPDLIAELEKIIPPHNETQPR